MKTKMYFFSKELRKMCRSGLCRSRLAVWFLMLIIAVSAVASYPCIVYAEDAQGGTADTISTAAARSIAKAKVTGLKSRTWTGKALTQKPVVKLGSRKLRAGTDYTISYRSNKNVGRATMIIRGKGRYTGTIKRTFIIKPKPTRLVNLIRRGSVMTVYWKKQSRQTSGYQFSYTYASRPRNTRNIKRVRVKSARATSRRVKISAARYRYAVWIRTYKQIGSRYYFSDWSPYLGVWKNGDLEFGY